MNTLTIPSSVAFVTYSLADAEGSEEDYVATISASNPEIETKTEVRTMATSTPSLSNETLPEVPNNYTTPEVQLRAYDEEGRLVGVNDSTGEYETEVPGVDYKDVSGNRQPLKWIATPSNRSIQYEVDTSGVEEWISNLRQNTG